MLQSATKSLDVTKSYTVGLEGQDVFKSSHDLVHRLSPLVGNNGILGKKLLQTTFQTFHLLIGAYHHNLQPPHPSAAGRQTEDQRRDKLLSGEPCRSGLTDSTPHPHFFDLPGSASQLTGTTDGPGVGKSGRQLFETADSSMALQKSWRSWLI